MNKLTKTILTSFLSAGLFLGSGSTIFASGSSAEPISSDPYSIYAPGSVTLPDLPDTLPSDDSDILFEKVVSGVDSRQAVSDTTAYPYSAVCKLVITFTVGGHELRNIGTGFLIDSNTVLTAGHCVYERQYGMASSISVTPAAGADGSEPFGTQVVTTPNMFVNEAWKQTSSTEYDFAILKLNQPVDARAGSLKLAANPAASVGEIVEITGYPYEKNQDIRMLPQYYDENRVLELDPRKPRTLYHVVDTGAGQSGSPILNADNEVIGIHTFGLASQPVNGGVLIDAYVRDFINECANTHVVGSSKKDAPVYRVYNPTSGEHFYTPSKFEADTTVANGWNDEGIAWYSQTNGPALYRLYNPNSGDHHYTLDRDEADALVGFGWNDEGIAWNASSDPNASAVYRLYNPNAITGAHHFTTNAAERDLLMAAGWQYEGVAFRSN